MPATISMQRGPALDGSLKKATMSFLEKLMADPTNPSLHIEPIKNSADPRARTGRVNDQFRAVLFKLQGTEEEHYVFTGVYGHDEGIEKAKRSILRVNPVNGITELIEQTMPDDSADTAKPSGKQDKPDSQKKAEEAAKAAAEKAEREAAEHQEQGDATNKAANTDTGNAEGAKKDVETPPAKKPASTTPLSEKIPHTAEELEQELGIDPHAYALVADLTEEELSNALAAYSHWVEDAFIGLLAGLSLDDIRESLGMDYAGVDEKEDQRTEDEKAIDGLKTPGAQMEFVYLEEADADELRKVIETQDFNAWRVFIHPEQREMVMKNFGGSARVFGGAGTGKTVVAVHRANLLVSEEGDRLRDYDHLPSVLLTTFTRALADSLKSQMNSLNPHFMEAPDPGQPGLWIGGIDSVVSKVLANTPRAEIERATLAVLGRSAVRARPFQGNAESQAWQDAILLEGEGLAPSLANETFLKQELETVVLANEITEQKAYLRVARRGRGTSLNRSARKQVWAIIENFMTTCAREGFMSFPVLAAVAAQAQRIHVEDQVARGEEPRHLFDHVVIDEAQDFHVGHWKFLRAAVAKHRNDIFLAEDSHQRIYGQHLVLRHFGIETRGRASKRLTLNYRTTRENLAYALKALDGEWFDAEDELDEVKGYRSARSGPMPRVLHAANEEEELDLIRALIDEWTEKDSDVHVGVLTRTRPQINRAVSGLEDRGIDAVRTRNATAASEHPVTVMTMHSSKGMEFTHVILFGVNDNVMPMSFAISNLEEAERNDALQRERSLLYVAASRARDELVITTSGKASKLVPAV